jgi:DNA-binding protein HU-beta
MTKGELIVKIAEDASITKVTAKKAVDSVIREITKTLSKGETIRLQDFGTFEVKKRAARVGKNPRTGESVRIPAVKAPVFRPSHKLKEKVR